MLNLTLLKKEIQSNYKIIAIFFALITLYSTVIVTMFNPDLGKSLEMMAKSMPEIFSALGMKNPGSTLLEFVTNYLYGFILLIVPSICIIIITSRLVTRYIDQGSMAYLLATPNSRKRIITSQAFMLIITAVSIVAYATTIIITISHFSFPNALNISSFIIVNIGLLGLLLFLASLCFLGTCIFNEPKFANGLGSGAIILFVLLQMLSQVGDTFSFLKYATPLTLFDVTGIINGDTTSYLMIATLYIGASILFCIAIRLFCRKDLSI